MKQQIRISREKSLSILALEGIGSIGSIGSIIAGRLKHRKGCRKIGRLEAMQEGTASVPGDIRVGRSI